MVRTLDVPEVQVLVDFFGDADGLFWHHRLLLQQGPDSRWIWATPDLDVKHGLLSRHRVMPLLRTRSSRRTRWRRHTRSTRTSRTGPRAASG